MQVLMQRERKKHTGLIRACRCACCISLRHWLQRWRHALTAPMPDACADGFCTGRYVNVLPYDHNRVELHPEAAQDGHAAAGGYINASHVAHADSIGQFVVQYIATQGPLPSTVETFWQMCSEQRVAAIIMLTNTSEKGTTKCCTYFPQQPGARLALRGSGGEVVAAASETLHHGDLTHRRLQLTGRAGAAPSTVHQLQYHAWPDHGTPAESAALRTMCELLGPIRAAGGAVVVHCSAGIGRTGTFIALDILRMRLAALARQEATDPGSVAAAQIHAALDLPALVASLRQQRCGMVQTLEQYAFVYHALREEVAAGGDGLPPEPTANGHC
jgi:protein tyrosine phosphatase